MIPMLPLDAGAQRVVPICCGNRQQAQDLNLEQWGRW